MIDVGLVGFGLGGRAFHAPIIHQVPGMRLAAILQRNGNASQEFYPDAKVVRDLDELLAIKSISLIAIATPNETHFPYAKRALEAGKHVVVDKPFTNYPGGSARTGCAGAEEKSGAVGVSGSEIRRRFPYRTKIIGGWNAGETDPFRDRV